MLSKSVDGTNKNYLVITPALVSVKNLPPLIFTFVSVSHNLLQKKKRNLRSQIFLVNSS